MEGKRKSQKEVKKVPTVKISLLSHNRVGKKNDEFANWKKQFIVKGKKREKT